MKMENTMKRFLTSASAAILAIVGASAAHADDATIDIIAAVGSICVLEDAEGGNAGDDSFLVTIDGDSKPETTSRTFTMALVCTVASNITLSSQLGAVTNADATVVGGSDNFFNYTAVASGGDSGAVTLTTVNGGAQSTSASAFNNAAGTFNGDVSVTITPIAAQGLTEGVYGDTLTVDVSPQ